MSLFLWMIAGHYFGDYALQSDWIAINKCKSLYVLLAHTVIWTTCVCIPIAIYSAVTPMILSVLVSHFFIDQLKCMGVTNLWHDQAMHIIQIIIVRMMIG